MTDRRSDAVLVGIGLSKSYGATHALRDVDLTLFPGERHAVTGENGAGKSTLIKVLGGIVKADVGTVTAAGAHLIETPAHARQAGIAIVHQHLSLVPTMTVEENSVLHGFPTRRGVIDRRAMRIRAREAMAQVGLDLDPAAYVSDLSFAERQLLEIGRALLAGPRVLVLDEPTSALTPGETERLFEILLGLGPRFGTALVYVSHRISEIYAVAERATVLRDGAVVDRLELRASPPSTLVRAMVGRELDLLIRREPSQSVATGTPVLEVRDLAGHRVHEASFVVHAGEIVAIAGLVGAGRTELIRQIFGIDARDAGTVIVGGTALPSGRPGAALKAGVGFVPEDRHGDGLALTLTNTENAMAPSLDDVYAGGVLRPGRLRRVIEVAIRESGVRPPDPGLATSALSGGNQQKIVLGKWLARTLRLLILDEPTAGVDIEAKSHIHQRIAALADAGLAVLMVSSDLPEVLTLADRILVMQAGRIVGEITRGPDWTETRVIELATGDHERAPTVVA